ncbi:MAG: AmmeMemoRadiSam system protein B [Desulfobacteraceae bacterium]|nr:AmmeMemoRadiSam system protein B [Desulfobacteraceae bacterium]
MKARRSVFAGSWYPGDPDGCEREIKDFLKQSDTSPGSDRKLVGGITPHAGWFFSGSIACNVINSLKGEDPVDVIVIFGMHLHPDSPNYMMKQGAWETPFGELQIAEELAEELAKRFKFNIETSERFSRDNTIELQLPFIKYFFKDTKIIPIGVPPAEKSLEIGKVAVDISKELGLQMKVIGSTDLTHYGSNYGYEPKGTGAKALDWVRTENDRRAIDAMVAMEPEEVIREGLSNQNACCAGAVATAIAAAKQLGAEKGESIAYATSYDKSPGSNFVGYAGIVF